MCLDFFRFSIFKNISSFFFSFMICIITFIVLYCEEKDSFFGEPNWTRKHRRSKLKIAAPPGSYEGWPFKSTCFGGVASPVRPEALQVCVFPHFLVWFFFIRILSLANMFVNYKRLWDSLKIIWPPYVCWENIYLFFQFTWCDA